MAKNQHFWVKLKKFTSDFDKTRPKVAKNGPLWFGTGLRARKIRFLELIPLIP